MAHNALERTPELSRYLENRAEILALYLFGSQAEDIARPNSDVDVAVLMRPHVTRKQYADHRLQYLTDLQTFAQGTLDLIILNQVPPLLQFHVLRCGRLIFDPDPDRRADEEMKLLNRYYRTRRFYDFHFDKLMEQIKKKGLGREPRSQRDQGPSQEARRMPT